MSKRSRASRASRAPKRDPVAQHRRQLRDLLGQCAPAIEAAMPVKVDNLFADLMLSCWRRSGWVPLVNGAAMAGIWLASADAFADDLIAEVAVMRRAGSYDAYLRALADRFGLGLDAFADRMIACSQRWRTPGLTAPDDWAIGPRMVLAISGETLPAWWDLLVAWEPGR